MSELNLPQIQTQQQETVVNIIENLFVDKQALFKKLQCPLSKIECQGKVVERICSELVSKEIFDPVVVDKYILGDGDFGKLVWEFRNEDQETFLKFLEVLKNLHDYPVTCKKFRRAIDKVMSENSAAIQSNVLSNLSSEGNQVPITDNTAFLTNVKQANEKFSSNRKAKISKLNDKTRSKNLWTFKPKAILAALVTVGTLLLVGLLLYLTSQQKQTAIIHNNSSTVRTPTTFTENILLEFTTIDPKTVETKVNETLYSYNFL